MFLYLFTFYVRKYHGSNIAAFRENFTRETDLSSDFVANFDTKRIKDVGVSE